MRPQCPPHIPTLPSVPLRARPILTLTRSRCIDRIRALDAASARDRKYFTDHFSPDVDIVSDSAIVGSEAAEVRRCLQQLTELQLASITLAFFQGHTHPETAEILRIPLPTVKTRIRDGLIRLCDCLELST